MSHLLELADLFLGQRGSHDPDRVAHPRLVHGEHIGVALDEDHPVGSRCRRSREVDPEQHLALVVELAVGGVEVLRALVVAHRPRAEAVDAAAAVDGREHDPLAEPVIDAAGAVARPLREPDREQLLLGEAARPRGAQHPVPRARRITDAELAQGLLLEPSAEQVRACRLRLAGLPQVARVVRRRPRQQRVQPFAALAAGGRARILVLGLELDAEAIGERFQRALEVQALGLLDEVERITGLLAAEAVVVLLVGPDVERRRSLVVKRAQAEVAVDARAPQLRARRDERQHVDRGQHAIPRVSGVAAHADGPSSTPAA